MTRRRTGFDWPRRASPRQGRAARGAGGVAAAAFGLALAGLALLGLRLLDGPVPLPWLAPRLQAAADAGFGPGRMALDSVAFAARSPGGRGPALRIGGLELRDEDGGRLFAAREVYVAFRALDLAQGRLRPTAVSAPGARIALRLGRDGRVALGAPADAPGESFDAAGLLALAAAGGPLDSLSEIALPGLRLSIADARSAEPWPEARGDLRLSLGGDAAQASGSLAWPDGLRAAFDARGFAGEAGAGGGGGVLRIGFDGARPATLARRHPGLPALGDAPLSGAIEAALGPDGALGALSGRVEAGAGVLALPGAPLRALDNARADFAWDPAAARLSLSRLEASGPSGEAALAGDIAFGAGGGATLSLRLSRLRIADRALLAAPVAFDGGALAARIAPGARAVEIDALSLTRGTLRLEAGGRVAAPAGEGGAAGATAEVAATLTGATPDDIVALWPEGVARGARAWLSRNLEAGLVDRAELRARLGPGGPELDLTFGFRDAVGHYLRPLPPIEGGAGVGVLTEDAFTLTLAAGRVAPPGGGTVDLGGSTFAVPDLGDPLSTALVRVTGEGPVPAILEVLDMPPLGFVRRVGLAPRAVAGRARATAELRLPLIADLRLDQVAVSAEAALADVDLVAPGVDAPMTAQALALTADLDRLTLAGDVTLAGAPLRLDLTETFAPAAGTARTALRLAGPVTAAQAAALGVDPGPRVGGRAGVEAAIDLRDGGVLDFEATLDLAGTTLEGAPLPWRKAAAQPGTARVSGRRDGAGLALRAIEADIGGLSLRGSADLARDGALRALRLTRLRLDGAADLALDLRAADGGWRVDAEGDVLDLDALAPAGGAGEAGAGMPVTARARIAELRLTDRLALRDADLTASRDRSGDVLARVDGRIGPGSAMAFVGYSSEGGDRRVRFAAEDAGAALRALGVFRRGIGGALEAEAEAAAGEDWRGELRIAELSIADDDPGLAALLDEADLDAALADLRRGALRFDSVRAPFVLRGGRAIFEEAVATGPSIGLSVSGAVDTADGALDLEGVFSPAFGVNRLLGDLPVIGRLFSGGEGQGLIGFTFAMRGPADDPEVRVNPLSGLLPGALRGLARPAGDPAQGARDREDWRARIEALR